MTLSESAPAFEVRLRHSATFRRRRRARALQMVALIIVIVAVASILDWSTFKSNFLNLDIGRNMFPDILTTGLRNTAVYSALGYSVGIVLGLIICALRMAAFRPYRLLAILYIELFRGLPTLLTLFIIAYGLPIALGHDLPGGTTGALALGLGLVGAGYMAETFRAGIQAVPTAQRDAARSLGMSKPRAMWYIVLPQAVRTVIPPLTNELIALIKDSSLVYVLGVTAATRDLTKFGQDALDQFANPTPLLLAGFCYLLITVPLSSLVRRLESATAGGRP